VVCWGVLTNLRACQSHKVSPVLLPSLLMLLRRLQQL
jgi:hypothetical protein